MIDCPKLQNYVQFQQMHGNTHGNRHSERLGILNELTSFILIAVGFRLNAARFFHMTFGKAFLPPLSSWSNWHFGCNATDVEVWTDAFVFNVSN